MSTFKITAAVIALSLADFGTTILCTRWLGATLTYSLFAVPMLLGLYIQWRRWKVVRKHMDAEIESMKAARASGQKAPAPAPHMFVEVLYWEAVTVLLLVPGLITAGLAFVLMLPSSRRKVDSWVSTHMFETKHDQHPTELADTRAAATESIEDGSAGADQTGEPEDDHPPPLESD